MAYSTITDLTRWVESDELIQLCTKDSSKTIVDPEVTDVVDEVIASADGEIDSYLLGRWSGLRDYSPVPDEINRLSSQIAVYYLYLRRRLVPEDWQRKYDGCIRKLEKAARGDLTLGLDASGAVATESENQYRSDALDTDSDLDSDDHRKYTQSKLDKL